MGHRKKEVTAKQCLEILCGEDQVAFQYTDLCEHLMKDGWQVCGNLKRLFPLRRTLNTSENKRIK